MYYDYWLTAVPLFSHLGKLYKVGWSDYYEQMSETLCHLYVPHPSPMILDYATAHLEVY